MIRVTGYAYIKVPYDVQIDMSEAEYDLLNRSQQNNKVFSQIDREEAIKTGEWHDQDFVTFEEIA